MNVHTSNTKLKKIGLGIGKGTTRKIRKLTYLPYILGNEKYRYRILQVILQEKINTYQEKNMEKMNIL